MVAPSCIGVAVAGEPDTRSEDVLPALEVALCRLKLVLGRMLGMPMQSCSVFDRSSGIAFP
jgi:hypothetical protein